MRRRPNWYDGEAMTDNTLTAPPWDSEAFHAELELAKAAAEAEWASEPAPKHDSAGAAALAAAFADHDRLVDELGRSSPLTATAARG